MTARTTGFNISMVAQRQGHGPQVLVKHYARRRPAPDDPPEVVATVVAAVMVDGASSLVIDHTHQ